MNRTRNWALRTAETLVKSNALAKEKAVKANFQGEKRSVEGDRQTLVGACLRAQFLSIGNNKHSLFLGPPGIALCFFYKFRIIMCEPDATCHLSEPVF